LICGRISRHMYIRIPRSTVVKENTPEAHN
jgi:hypothetical protein